MSKYYNNDIPVYINVTYGSRYSGKTYNEIKKLEKRIKELEKENKNLKDGRHIWYEHFKQSQHIINKAIKYLEDKSVYHTIEQFYDVTLFDEELTNLFNILKGKEKEENNNDTN